MPHTGEPHRGGATGPAGTRPNLVWLGLTRAEPWSVGAAFTKESGSTWPTAPNPGYVPRSSMT